MGKNKPDQLTKKNKKTETQNLGEEKRFSKGAYNGYKTQAPK